MSEGLEELYELTRVLYIICYMYVNVGFVRGFIPYYEWYSYSMGRLQVEIVLIQIYVICI